MTWCSGSIAYPRIRTFFPGSLSVNVSTLSRLPMSMTSMRSMSALSAYRFAASLDT